MSEQLLDFNILISRMVGQVGDMELANYQLILMSRLQHQMLMLSISIYKFITQIIVLSLYTCCPGWVKTDMAAEGALLTIVEGALTPVYLVELPHEVNPAYQGQFFHLQKVQEL